MHAKHAASELRAMALRGAVAACEMRAFAARHAATLDAANHADFVEAFVLQLGRPEQHAAVLALLAGVERGFRGGKIAYKPPGGAPPRAKKTMDTQKIQSCGRFFQIRKVSGDRPKVSKVHIDSGVRKTRARSP